MGREKVMKSALVTGVNGQDGSFLAELLVKKGYEVHGLIRRSSQHPENLRNLNRVKDAINLHFGDLASENHLSALVSEIKPTEIYHLGAQSDVRVSFDIPESTIDITGLGTIRLLEAVRKFSKESRVYLAGSSEMYGDSLPPQSETTVFNPQNPYATAKLMGFHNGKIYRKAYDLFISNGILFNHESERRGLNFVTRKITNTAVKIKLGKVNKLSLGNISSKRDWGYAGEYVYAMWTMLQQKDPDDFVIGTGKVHTVKDFVIETFNYLKINNWENYVDFDPNMLRAAETSFLQADPTKAKKDLGWEPQVDFKTLVKIMCEHDLKIESV
jgi:GDPmannose 4,6-dehydratase